MPLKIVNSNWTTSQLLFSAHHSHQTERSKTAIGWGRISHGASHLLLGKVDTLLEHNYTKIELQKKMKRTVVKVGMSVERRQDRRRFVIVCLQSPGPGRPSSSLFIFIPSAHRRFTPKMRSPPSMPKLPRIQASHVHYWGALACPQTAAPPVLDNLRLKHCPGLSHSRMVTSLQG